MEQKVYFKESDNVTLPKDVTVTDNQLPIDGGIAESGSYDYLPNVRLSKILLVIRLQLNFT